MAVQGGFGIVVKINTGSLTTITNLLDVDFPGQDKTLVPARFHNSTNGYMEYIATGLRELQAFSMTLGWDDTEATHAQALTSYDADTAIGMSIEDPGGQEVIAFDAHIQNILREGKQEDLYKATINVQPTGNPTIT